MKKHFLTVVALFTAVAAFSQVDKDSDLYKTILRQDSLLFDVGFNTCNIRQVEMLLSDSLKFYHDKDGISGKQKFVSDLRKGICNDVAKRNVKRFLVKENTEIFPLYKDGVLYGAVQNGAHLIHTILGMLLDSL